jgi:CheY-like chemotaxis protein
MLEGLRILIVEDDFLLAETVVTALEKAGCEVIGPAARLGQAVELAERGGFDVALMDINLHGETCYPAAWLLLERGVPFAFMTAYSPAAIPRRLAFIAVLAKPFGEAELLETVATLRQRALTAAASEAERPLPGSRPASAH